MDYLTLLLRMQERQTEQAGEAVLPSSGQAGQMRQMLAVLRKARQTEQAAPSLRERRTEFSRAEYSRERDLLPEEREVRFPERSMAEISRFFERDARRYGG